VVFAWGRGDAGRGDITFIETCGRIAGDTNGLLYVNLARIRATVRIVIVTIITVFSILRLNDTIPTHTLALPRLV
jgi:hypothetical protein